MPYTLTSNATGHGRPRLDRIPRSMGCVVWEGGFLAEMQVLDPSHSLKNEPNLK